MFEFKKENRHESRIKVKWNKQKTSHCAISGQKLKMYATETAQKLLR